MIEVEHEFKESMHLVFLHNPRLTQSTQYRQERCSFVLLKCLYRDVGHIDDHYIVAEICLVEADFCLVELSTGLFNF